MATHSSTLAWKIPRTEEPGGLQFMGSQRVGHTEQLLFHFSLSCIGEGNGNPLQCSCLENPRDGGSWWAAVYGVTQSWTRLKWLSSSSSGTANGMVTLGNSLYMCGSGVSNSVTLWTVAHQAPLSMGFSRQDYWSGCAIFLLHGIFPTQGLNPISCVSCTASGFFTCWAIKEA